MTAWALLVRRSYLVHARREQLYDCELASMVLQLLPSRPVVKGALYLHLLPSMAPYSHHEQRHAISDNRLAP